MKYNESPPLDSKDQTLVDGLVNEYLYNICLKVKINEESDRIVDSMISMYENPNSLSKYDDINHRMIEMEFAFKLVQENLEQIRLWLKTTKIKY